MSLSVGNRRRMQTPTSQSSARLPLSVRKQYSFIEPSTYVKASSKFTAQQRGYLTRGLSVGRSIENIRQKLYPPIERQRPSGVGHLSRQQSLDVTHTFANKVVNSKSTLQVQPVQRFKEKSLVAWSSTSSLLAPSLESERQKSDDIVHGISSRRESISITDASSNVAKADKNRINLNIVLAQTIRATNEPELSGTHSDIDSSTECASDLVKTKAATGTAKATATATATLIGTGNCNEAAIGGSSAALSVSPALTVQRRPPLLRAMSAPVRGLDESSKSVIAANKRQQKLRRRKIFSRNISCDKSSDHGSPSPANLLLSAEATGNSAASSSNKKVLARARTVVAPDVITLVSLLSSEGSDSEHEDECDEHSAASTPVNSSSSLADKQRQASSPTRRAPLLRKTGKSVSFQDSYPPTFQLASKEYSHMIRRGSIAPLAARIRANRPPTAPPVSIFLNEPRSSAMAQADSKSLAAKAGAATAASAIDESKPRHSEKENNNNAANCNMQSPPPPPPQEYNYPVYVRSIKERECWKLFQKMCDKGVTVTYDTVLRGMLTPTEFRHFQKQREDTEAAEAAAAAAAAAAAEEAGPEKERKAPASAIERLSESLLSNK